MPVEKKTTITAEATTQPVQCHSCGRCEPRRNLWGLDRNRVTTADLQQVASWVCADCFAAH